VEESVGQALSQVGWPITVTSIVLAAGFAALYASAFNITAFMGILTAVIVLFALFVDLLFVPVLATWLKEE